MTSYANADFIPASAREWYEYRGPIGRTPAERPGLLLAQVGRRMVQNVVDVQHIHLPTETLVCGVDRNNPAVPAESRVGVHAKAVVRTRALQFRQGHKLLRRSMKEEQVLKAVHVVGVCNDPFTAGAGNEAPVPVAAETVVHVHWPEQLLGRSSPVILEHEVPGPSLVAARRPMTAEIKNEVVVQPGVVARIVVQVANVRTIRGHRIGLVEFVLRILDEHDEPLATWAPALAEDVEASRFRDSAREGDRGQLVERHDELRLAAIHVHLPDAGLVRRRPALGLAFDGGVICSLMVALEIVGEGSAAVRRQVIYRPRQRPPLTRLEVVQPADEGLLVVGPIVPGDLIRCGPPLQPRALLPVPGGRRADRFPLVVVLQIDHANLGAIIGTDISLVEVDAHAQEVARRRIELEALIEEKARVDRILARPRIGDTRQGRIARTGRLHEADEVGEGRIGDGILPLLGAFGSLQFEDGQRENNCEHELTSSWKNGGSRCCMQARGQTRTVTKRAYALRRSIAPCAPPGSSPTPGSP